MKKLYWTTGTFFLGTFAQLVCVIMFLFLDNEPINKTIILAAFLFLSSADVVVQDFMLSKLARDGALDDTKLGIAAALKRLIGTLLGLEIANMLIWAVSSIFTLPFFVYVLLAVAFVLACIISVTLLMVSLRREQDTDVEK